MLRAVHAAALHAARAAGGIFLPFLRVVFKEDFQLAHGGLHAGEHGAFGDEDGTIIAPAVERLGAIHPDAEFDGPSVPDCVYRDAVEGNYDAVLAPYHDQGLIPLKLVDFHTAVNVTLGLPRPRLSPDHGTAFNLAGAGKANPSSTIHAFQLAVRMAQTR